LTRSSGGSGLAINMAATPGVFTSALVTYGGVTKTDMSVRFVHSIDFRPTQKKSIKKPTKKVGFL